MTIDYERFKGDAEGDAEAAKARATTGSKAERLSEIRNPSNAADLAAYGDALKVELITALGGQLRAQDESQ